MTPGKAYMTSAALRPLAARSDLLGALLVAHCWAVIAAQSAHGHSGHHGDRLAPAGPGDPDA